MIRNNEYYKYNEEKDSFTINKSLFVISVFVAFLLSYFFYDYVYDNGNMFDYILISIMILFFKFQIGRQFYVGKNRYFKLIKLKRLYKISIETDEEKYYRILNEKLTRILKKKKFGFKEKFINFVKTI